MRAEITHYTVTTESAASALFPIEHFASNMSAAETYSEKVVYQASREFNWPQSFARKGLKYEDYSFITQMPANTFRFDRIKDQGIGPLTIEFHRSGAPDAALQGEILTFEKQELVLPVHVVDRTTVPLAQSLLKSKFARGVPGEFLTGLGKHWCHSRLGWILFLRESLAKSQDVSCKIVSGMIEQWTPEQDFVHLKTVHN